jgi:hypothetical protein
VRGRASWPFVGCGSWIAGIEDIGPCLDNSESGTRHLATLPTPPVLSDTRLMGPSGLGHEGEVTEAPQPRTVEAMCKANWPAQRQPTEAGRATLERGTMVLKGSLLARRASHRQRGPGPGSKGVAMSPTHCEDSLSPHTSSQLQGTKVKGPLTFHHKPSANSQSLKFRAPVGFQKRGASKRRRDVAECRKGQHGPYRMSRRKKLSQPVTTRPPVTTGTLQWAGQL